MKLSRLFQLSTALVAVFTLTSSLADEKRPKRVAGAGTLARTGQFPHTVFLYWYWHIQPFRQITRFKCTGNLLTPKYVVTAAHCYFHLLFTYRNFSSELDFVRNLTEDQGLTFVRAGSTDGFEWETGYQDRVAEKVFIPNTYVKPSTMFDLDVALLYIPMFFIVDRPNVSHVALASRSTPIGEDDHRDCIAAGYGYETHRDAQLVVKPKMKLGVMGVRKNKLRWYPVKVGRQRFCKYLQFEMDETVVYFDTFYACGQSTGTRAAQTYTQACFGDAGGPLMCNGLLTGILVQRRESLPCDFFRGTAFAMFTMLGAPEVDEWMRKYVPDVPAPLQLPPWDPWNTTGSSGRSGTVNATFGMGPATGLGGVEAPPKQDSGNANGSFEGVGVQAGALNSSGKEAEAINPARGRPRGTKDFIVSEKILEGDVTARKEGKVRRDIHDKVGVLKEGSEKVTRESPKLRRNVHGQVVAGELQDDDPDLIKLTRLIRSGVNVDPNGDNERKKRQAASVHLKEEMAKDLLRAVRDLDPGALARLGMEADVLTSEEDFEDDEWAKEVWRKVYGESI